MGCSTCEAGFEMRYDGVGCGCVEKADLSIDEEGSGLDPSRGGREKDVSVTSRGDEGNDWV